MSNAAFGGPFQPPEENSALFLLHIGFIASIAFAPFYFGGERLLAWGILGLFQSMIFIALSTLNPSTRRTDKFEDGAFKLAFLFVLMPVIWGVIQLIPFSHNSFANPIWIMADAEIDVGEHYPMSLAPDEGYLTLLKLIIVALTLLNAKRLYSAYRKPTELLVAVAYIGLIYALIGLIWFRIFPGQHIWLDRSPYQTSVVSTHVNRNSFAQYLGIVSLCALSLAIREWKKIPKSQTIGSAIQNILSITFRKFILYLAVFSTLFVTLLMTISRAGIICAIIAYFAAISSQSSIKKRNILVSLLGMLFVTTAIFTIYDRFSGGVDARSGTMHQDFFGRNELYGEIWSTILDSPIFGYGFGSFEPVFRFHKAITFDSATIWHRAHNVYLDAIFALGFPASTLLLIAIVILIFISIRRMVLGTATTPTTASISIYVLVGLHSCFDFGIQAGGNAITFAALIGAALSAPLRHVNLNR